LKRIEIYRQNISERGDNVQYKTTILAALIHDIGQFLQRGSQISPDTTGDHWGVSARFIEAYSERLKCICDTGLLNSLVIKNYGPGMCSGELTADSTSQKIKPLTYMINSADAYSSYEGITKSEGYQRNKRRPLDSVFCRLNIGKKTPPMLQYAANVYSPENGYPVQLKENSVEKIDLLINQFEKEYNDIVKQPGDFWSFYNKLYSLLLKYTWCIPSNTRGRIADVSLFDHLKTTSAITACLYIYHESNNDFSIDSIEDNKSKKFRLIVGDLSGIQNYIFSGANIGAGGVARRLRARSFFLSMLSELISHQVIEMLGLPIANLIISSGGKFYLLVPNTAENVSAVSRFSKEIDEWLLEEFQGEIGLNMVSLGLSGDDFRHFGTVVGEINRKLGIKKKIPFGNAIKDNKKWKEDKFVFEANDVKGLGLCKGCEREFAVTTKEKPYGEKCLKDLKIGQILPRVKCLLLTKHEDSDISLKDGMGVKLLTSIPQQSSESLTMILNSNKVYPHLSMINKYIANYVPHDDQYQTITFEELSNKSQGVSMLGYLKADVDYLGNLFALGLKGDAAQGQENYDTISRVTTLSRMLDLFFSGRLNQLVSQEFNNCYMVFSGGDDLLIIGPWNEIIQLSIRLKKEFSEYTGHNPNITISAGIAIARCKSPIAKVIETVEELLEDSKEKVLQGRSTGRDQVTLFNRTLGWEEFIEAVEEGQILSKWIADKKLSHGDLWKLKLYDRMFQMFENRGNVYGLKYSSFLAYDLGRKKRDRRTDYSVIEWHEKLFELNSNFLVNLGVIADYAICTSRKGRDDDEELQ